MLVYFIPFFVAFFASLKYEVFKIKDDGRYFIWYLLYFFLVGLIGLRYMVGGDSYVYMLYFNSLSPNEMFNLSWDSDYQPLFVLLVSISKAIYPSFVSFQIIHAIIINTCLFYIISRKSDYPFATLFFCLVIFYINFSVEILRESLAIIVFVFNYKNIEKKKWGRYYFGVLISILFHISAIFLIVIPFVRYLRFNIWYLGILLIIILTLNQLQFLFTVFEDIEKVNKKINDYSEATYGWKSTVLFFITRTLIPVGLFYWVKRQYGILIKYEPLMCLFGLLGICSIFNTIIFTRFTNYMIVFYCITLADVLVPFFQFSKITVNKMIISLILVLIIFTYSYMSFNWPTGYYEKWVPYYSIFSNESSEGRFIDRDY